MARRVDKPFAVKQYERPRDSASHTIEAAINAAGDAVFAWEGSEEIYALVRRRDGRTSGVQHLTADGPPTAESPTAAIDGDGRAVVAWNAQTKVPSQIDYGEIRAATAGRNGRFGGSVVISGPEQKIDDFPEASVNERGEAAVMWTRVRLDYRGIIESRLWVARGNLAAAG